MLVHTGALTLDAFIRHGLSRFVPLVIILLVLAIIFFVIGTASVLAPFVYPLL